MRYCLREKDEYPSIAGSKIGWMDVLGDGDPKWTDQAKPSHGTPGTWHADTTIYLVDLTGSRAGGLAGAHLKLRLRLQFH